MHAILDEQQEKRREHARALHEETIERLGSVLSAEQIERFKQLSESRHPRHPRDREFL